MNSFVFPASNKHTTKSGKKIPAGGVSIFGDDGDGMFTTAAKAEPKAQTQPKSEPQPQVTKSLGGGLFDDDDDDDLFASMAQPASKGKAVTAPTSNNSKSKANKVIGQYSQNYFNRI